MIPGTPEWVLIAASFAAGAVTAVIGVAALFTIIFQSFF
jgi:hypothetical protein